MQLNLSLSFLLLISYCLLAILDGNGGRGVFQKSERRLPSNKRETLAIWLLHPYEACMILPLVLQDTRVSCLCVCYVKFQSAAKVAYQFDSVG